MKGSKYGNSTETAFNKANRVIEYFKQNEGVLLTKSNISDNCLISHSVIDIYLRFLLKLNLIKKAKGRGAVTYYSFNEGNF